MLQLVDYWAGGYKEEVKCGILDTESLIFNYYTRNRVIELINQGNKINGLNTLYSFDMDSNDTNNKFITRVLSSTYKHYIKTSYSKKAYDDITLVLHQPIKLNKLISGMSFEYKDIKFCYTNEKSVGRRIIITQPSWKDSHLQIIKEIVNMVNIKFVIEIKYPFRVNKNRGTLDLQPLLDILNNRNYILTACNENSNYSAISNINVGKLDFSKLYSFYNIFKYSKNLKYIDFSNSVSDLDLFNNCIAKNVCTRQIDKIQDSLNSLLYFIQKDTSNYPIVFVLRPDMKCFAEFLCSDRRVIYLGTCKRDKNISNSIDILIGKFIILNKNGMKPKSFLVFVE